MGQAFHVVLKIYWNWNLEPEHWVCCRIRLQPDKWLSRSTGELLDYCLLVTVD